jgi:hypothetical protein
MALELAWYDWVGLLGTVIICWGFPAAGGRCPARAHHQLLSLFSAAGSWCP